ncbi:MAG: glycosyltransferase family 4 protein [Eubacterium sp.]|nr:glycosyltransferase family 4 protein [Eubacterium sp.]
MKKIGFVNFDMSVRGGGQQVLCNIANALAGDEADERYEVYVISLTHEKGVCTYSLDPCIHYHNILPGRRRIREVVMGAGKEFRAYCLEQGIELLFYVAVYAGFCGGVIGRRLKMPKIFCDHGSLLSQWDDKVSRTLRRFGRKYADRTVVLTKQSETAYYEKFRCKPGEIMTIYNWLDDNILKHAGSYEVESKKILTAGRFSPEKGMDLLVDVAVALRKKTHDFVWEVYGEGEMFDGIQKRIREEGLQENVKLLGLTDRMETCYQGHCMYVLTSYREGLPLVLLEAKANHLPIVSFDIVSGPAEIIQDGIDGILVPPYDTEKMAEEIYGLLMDKGRRIEMSQHCSDNQGEFAKEKILDQWKALIEEMTV